MAERIHPLDRDRVLDLYFKEPHVTNDYDTEYSALTIKGQFVLIRDVVHVARNANGDIEALMGFMICMRLGQTHQD
jgi:hypothetical protein